MHPHVIVMREMKRDGGLQVFKFLAESVGQPSKPAHAHTHGQISTLNQACRNMNRIRLGNLCLLTDVNRALGNKSWIDKLAVFKKSRLRRKQSKMNLRRGLLRA
jgi:hypothetical protein